MAEDVAVQGLTLSSTAGTAVVTSSPSTNVKADNKSIYTTPLNVTVTGASQGTCQNASGSGTINATAIKVKNDGSEVMRKNDNGTFTVNGTESTPPFNPCSFSVTVTITDAGQNKVEAE